MVTSALLALQLQPSMHANCIGLYYFVLNILLMSTLQ